MIGTRGFELLRELENAGIRGVSEKKEFYHAHKEELKQEVVTPFQDLFRAVVALLPEMALAELQTQRDLFSRILPQGYPQAFYWGALVARDVPNKRSGPQLIAFWGPHHFEWGLTWGADSDTIFARFVQACRQHGAELAPLFEQRLGGTGLRCGVRPEERFKSSYPLKTLLLKPDATPDACAVRVLSPDQVVGLPQDEFASAIAQTWVDLLPMLLIPSKRHCVKWTRMWMGKFAADALTSPDNQALVQSRGGKKDYPSVHDLLKEKTRVVQDGEVEEDNETSDVWNPVPANLEEARRRVVVELYARGGQSRFRAKVLAAYSGKCAVTGCDAIPALEAAHIQPYRDGGDATNHIQNGLLLRADIHRLFDLGLLACDTQNYHGEAPMLTLMVAPELRETQYSAFNGLELSLPEETECQPNKAALDWQRAHSLIG